MSQEENELHRYSQEMRQMVAVLREREREKQRDRERQA